VKANSHRVALNLKNVEEIDQTTRPKNV